MLQLLVGDQYLPVLFLGSIEFVEIQMISFLYLNKLLLHFIEQLVVERVLLALLSQKVAELLVLLNFLCELKVVLLQKKNLLV